MLYFDHNATSPLNPVARESWLEATSRFIGNPSSPHRLGARADAALTQAREKLAHWLGCNPLEIIWTSGATEASNTVVQHFAAGTEAEAWVSAIEHPCVKESVRRAFPGRHRFIPVESNGVVAVDWLRTELKTSTPAFVGVIAANNETGVLQPWREIVALCREHNVPYFCDAAQWIGKMPLDELGSCDFLTGCGHKFGAPQGAGFLKCPGPIRPLLVGGPQEEGQRAGTENVAGVLAMIAALEALNDRMAELPAKQAARAQFEAALLDSLPGSQIVGVGSDRLWNTVSAMMPEIDCRQRWVVKLDKLGFAVSTGSACASGQEKPSDVLAAMGLSPAQASRVLRFSAGWETTAEEWAELLRGISRASEELIRDA